MKKNLIVTLALIFIFGIVGTAFASAKANPFVSGKTLVLCCGSETCR